MLTRPVAVVLVVMLLVAALVGVQGVAAQVAPAGPSADTGRLLGTTGFAYLSGIRVFAAAVLWNRLEPQFHQYYETADVEDLTFLMPSLYLVQHLDPTFVQAYYNAAFILARRGQWDEAFRCAEDGVANNPGSGLMRANYVQILLMKDRDANRAAAYKQALVGMGAGVTYDNVDDEYESLAVFKSVFERAGRTDLVARIEQRHAQLKAMGAQATGLSHDHDGDGHADH